MAINPIGHEFTALVPWGVEYGKAHARRPTQVVQHLASNRLSTIILFTAFMIVVNGTPRAVGPSGFGRDLGYKLATIKLHVNLAVVAHKHATPAA